MWLNDWWFQSAPPPWPGIDRIGTSQCGVVQAALHVVRHRAVRVAGHRGAQRLVDDAVSRSSRPGAGTAASARSSGAAPAAPAARRCPAARVPSRAVEDEVHAGLAAVDDDLALAAADAHVGEHRRHHVVHVPDVVVDRLEVPPVLAGLQVQRDDRVGEQVLPAARRAVLRRAAARVAEGPVDQAELGIDGRVDPRRRAAASRSRSRPPRCRCRTRPGRGTPQKCQSTSPLVASSASAAPRLPSLVPMYSSAVVVDDGDLLDVADSRSSTWYCFSTTTAPVSWSSAMSAVVVGHGEDEAVRRRRRRGGSCCRGSGRTPLGGAGAPSTAMTLPSADSM